MSTEEKLGGGGRECRESNIEPEEILERGVTSSNHCGNTNLKGGLITRGRSQGGHNNKILIGLN